MTTSRNRRRASRGSSKAKNYGATGCELLSSQPSPDRGLESALLEDFARVPLRLFMFIVLRRRLHSKNWWRTARAGNLQPITPPPRPDGNATADG
jgi:hypothetical protein